VRTAPLARRGLRLSADEQREGEVVSVIAIDASLSGEIKWSGVVRIRPRDHGGPLDRVAHIAERKYCRPQARPFRLGFPREPSPARRMGTGAVHQYKMRNYPIFSMMQRGNSLRLCGVVAGQGVVERPQLPPLACCLLGLPLLLADVMANDERDNDSRDECHCYAPDRSASRAHRSPWRRRG
jgi:hypothetical protein